MVGLWIYWRVCKNLTVKYLISNVKNTRKARKYIPLSRITNDVVSWKDWCILSTRHEFFSLKLCLKTIEIQRKNCVFGNFKIKISQLWKIVQTSKLDLEFFQDHSLKLFKGLQIEERNQVATYKEQFFQVFHQES